MRRMFRARFVAPAAVAATLACANTPPRAAGQTTPRPHTSAAPPAASALPPTQAPEAMAAPPPEPAASETPAEDAASPLAPALQQKLRAIRPDPPPPAITRERHYLVSNENQHHLWHEVVSDLGGIQVGVGTEQNYLLAGWARPQVLILVDYDEWVAELNRVYGVAFEHADTPDEFLELWELRSDSKIVGWIRERWPDQQQHWKKVRAYRGAQAEVRLRLQRLRERHSRREVACFLTDPSQYQYLAQLWRNGRVRSVRGDLVQHSTLQDIAAFARAAAMPIRLLYLSNAEDYFWYNHLNFKANMLALPFDDRSLVLHTKPYQRDFYRYVFQSGLGYQDWLRSGRVRSWCELFSQATATSPDGKAEDLRTVSLSPDDAPSLPRRLPCSQPGGGQ